jgi:hypothetical protein
MEQQNSFFKSFLVPSFRSFRLAILDPLSNPGFWLKMRLQHFTIGSLVTSSLAVNLYVSSYAGTITTLQLSRDEYGYSLETLAVNSGSAPQPSWLEKNKYNGIIYCVNEDWNRKNGTIASYRASASGALTQIDIHDTIGGPVSEVVYNGGKGLAVAH